MFIKKIAWSLSVGVVMTMPTSTMAGSECPPAVLKIFRDLNHGYESGCKVVPSVKMDHWKNDGLPGYTNYEYAYKIALSAVAAGGPFEGRFFTIVIDPNNGFTPIFRKSFDKNQ